MENTSELRTASSRPLSISFLAIVALALLASACGSFDVDYSFGEDGSGVAHVETLDLDLTDVTTIEVSDAWDVDIEVASGETAKVEITIDDNFLDYIDVTVTGETLRIALTRGNLDTKVGFGATVLVPEVAALTVNDASRVSVAGQSTSLATVSVSDAAAISVANLDLGKDIMFELDVSDASRATLKGKATAAAIAASDASDVDLAGLELATVAIDVSDASSLIVLARGEVTGTAADASNVEVRGGATVDVVTKDSSSVSEN